MKTRRIPTLADFSPALKFEGRRVAVDPGSRRIAVRVANFGETHSGFGPMVRVPRNVNVDAAHVGVAELADGSNVRVATLPMHTTHAPADLKAMHAASWYENTGTAIARGRYSIDDQGIRFDGVLYDDVDESTVDKLTASSASGDWRSAVAIKRFEDFETTPCDFVGSCVVNIPGFSDTFRQAPSERFALAASAHSIMAIYTEGDEMDDDQVLTAGGADSNPDGAGDLAPGCTGECTGCSCQTPTIDVNDPSAQGADTVTLKASALLALVAAAAPTVQIAAHVDTGVTVPATEAEVEAGKATRTPEELIGVTLDEAVEFAREALTAGGFISAPDPRDQKLNALERMVIDMAFNQPD